jgi:hypothetical protein
MLSQYVVTSIETKALCSVLRKAESKGERSLVEKMIEICDTQSGLRFEELWNWWMKHKQEDSNKITIDFQKQSIPDPLTFKWPTDQITIKC